MSQLSESVTDDSLTRSTESSRPRVAGTRHTIRHQTTDTHTKQLKRNTEHRTEHMQILACSQRVLSKNEEREPTRGCWLL